MVEQVIKFIKIANEFKIPVYSVSGGKNWGMGSSKPVHDGCVILNLSKLNRIVEVNEEFGYAVIEAGVTVGALCDHLGNTNSKFVANVGGGGKNVTIVGNTLDRGSGFYGSKKLEEVLAIESVLANGNIIKTGHWNLDPSSGFTHCYPYGYGPDLRGLFTQSNLGVVTKMVVKLYKRQRNIILHGVVQYNELDKLIDSFKTFRQNNLIGQGATFFVGEKGADFSTGMVLLNGSYNMMLSAKQEIIHINKDLHDIKLEFFDTNDLAKDGIPVYVKDLASRMYHGISDRHYYLNKLYEGVKDTKPSLDLSADIDSKSNNLGFLCINAACIFKGEIVKKVVKTIQSVSKDFSIAFTDLGYYGLKVHAATMFDRRDKDDCKNRHKLKDEVYKKLFDIGVYPQRLDIDNVKDFKNRYGVEYKSALKSIKKALDNKGILSPGRYI